MRHGRSYLHRGCPGRASSDPDAVRQALGVEFRPDSWLL